MALPMLDFCWIEEEEKKHDILQQLPHMDILHSVIGYTFEVDMVVPEHLHDLLDDLPLAPLNEIVDEPTALMMELWCLAEGRGPYHAMKKLILSHRPKTHYVIHAALLQFYMEMGMVVIKVHRIVQYKQSPFFEPYITFNSKKRQESTSDFEKDFFKLKNNGKHQQIYINLEIFILYLLLQLYMEKPWNVYVNGLISVYVQQLSNLKVIPHKHYSRRPSNSEKTWWE